MPKRRADDSGPPPSWRVSWQDYTNHHNWLGRGAKGKAKRDQKPPPVQVREFHTLSDALNWNNQLIGVLGRDKVVTSVASLRELLPPAQQQPLLPGEWRYQRWAQYPTRYTKAGYE